MNNFWQGKRVFITGAGGFIGSHLVELSNELGAEVTALVHYNSRNDWGLLEQIKDKNAENLQVIMGDLLDPFFLKKVLKKQEYVFHLAALIAIPFSYDSPNIYIATNIQGAANLFQACLYNDVTKIIHTSTSEVYGTAIYTPIDEEHPLQGQSPYSASKIGADMVAKSCAYSYKLPIAILRPFNTYGPRQSARAVIPTIITQALTRDKIELGALSPKRDFNFVRDTAQGFLCLAESPYADAEVFNLASCKQITIGELAQMILKLLGKNLPVLETTDRLRPDKSEVMSLMGDSAKLQSKTGWKPKVDFQEGLKIVIEYIERNISLYKTTEYVK